jgi:hypothetical protein
MFELLSDGMINPSSLIVLPESRRIIDVVMTPLAWTLPVSFNIMRINGHDSLNKIVYEYENSYLYVDPVAIGVIVLVVGGVMLIVVKRKK